MAPSQADSKTWHQRPVAHWQLEMLRGHIRDRFNLAIQPLLPLPQSVMVDAPMSRPFSLAISILFHPHISVVLITYSLRG